MTEESIDFRRGKEEGARDARLDEAFVRLNKINGSVERHAKSNESLARTVQVGFDKVASEIRTMQEEARLDRERVKVAAETLAAETERRRKELEAANSDTSGAWSLRANKATVISALVAILAVAYAIHPF